MLALQLGPGIMLRKANKLSIAVTSGHSYNSDLVITIKY